MTTDERRWAAEYECKFVPDPWLELAQEYHDRCDEYDCIVCTGTEGHDGPLPRTHDEQVKISRHAQAVLADIADREHINISDLRRAISRLAR